MFYILLLELVLLGAPRAPLIEIELVNLEAIYDVEEILDYKYVRGKVKYLIK